MTQIDKFRPDEALTQVLEFLGSGRVSPTPANYELMYKYVQGVDPDLVSEIRAAIDKGQSIDTQFVERLRLRLYGAEKRESEQMELLSAVFDATQAQLEQITTQMETAGGDAAAYTKALRTGSDYLQRDASPQDHSRLISQIVAATSAMIEKTAKLEAQLAMSMQEIGSLRKDLDRARQESRTDPLTGLPNRKAFFTYLESQAARALADRKSLCLLFCDIDHFNDTWGHRMGDEVLRLVGHSLEQQCQGIAFPARFGGEEFVIALPNKDLQAAQDIAEQLRDFVSTKTIRSKSNQQTVGRITMSIGIAEMRWRDSIEQLIERADLALYKAKETGRNKVCTERDLDQAAALAS
jgi:diguanylate cyclase